MENIGSHGTAAQAPLLSIVVPVYNVRTCLDRCVSSLLRQTYSPLEILLVDDGSTDGSGEMCDAYKNKDVRVRVIHKENGGLSDARNVGIAAAAGEYIGLVDSDDAVRADMYERLAALLEATDADMASCQTLDVYGELPPDAGTDNADSGGSGGSGKAGEPDGFSLLPEPALGLFLEGQRAALYAVNKLYRRHLFESVRYPVGKTYEDAFVIMDLCEACRRVAFTTERLYYYCHRDDSITTRAFSPAAYHVIEAHEKNYERIVKDHPALREVGEMRLCWSRFCVLDRMLASENVPQKDRADIVKYLRHHTGAILKNRYFTVARKAATAALFLSVPLYRRLALGRKK